MMEEVVIQDLTELIKILERWWNTVHSDRCLSVRTKAVQLNLYPPPKKTVMCLEKGPELWPNDWILCHDNAPVHEALCQAVSGQKINYQNGTPNLFP